MSASGFCREVCLSALALFSLPLWAEVVTDGSLGPALDLGGPDYVIGEEVGSRVGDNLFHSFHSFNVYQGESATFTGSSDIANVVSRVTGGGSSTIDGALRSEVGTADFYFINPAGVLFGPNASVDVPASFHVSTADHLTFADGARFSATEPGASSLTIASPEAFGFTGGRSADITIAGSLLTVPDQAVLSVSAGSIEVTDGTLAGERGEIRLIAAGADPVEIPVAGGRAGQAHGDLTLTSSNVLSFGDGGGRVLVQGGEVVVDSSVVATESTGSEDASQGVEVTAENLTLTNGGTVYGYAYGDGDSGGVTIETSGRMEITNGALISNYVESSGDGGPVSIQAGELSIESGPDLFTGISTSTLGGTGQAGSVEVSVQGTLELSDGAIIRSDTLAEGNAGDVRVEADGLRVTGDSEQWSSISTNVGFLATGDAGDLTVTVAGSLEMAGGSAIASDTFGAGNAGQVLVEAGTMHLQGTQDASSRISSTTWGGTGRAGGLVVRVTDLLELAPGATIHSNSYGEGDAGEVRVEAGSLRMQGNDDFPLTGVFTANFEGAAQAGKVEVVVADSLEVLGGSTISTSNYDQGDAGTVSVEAGQLTVNGEGSELFSSIESVVYSGTGNSGNVTVQVPGLLVASDGAFIASTTLADGNAGAVLVEAGGLTLDGMENGLAWIDSSTYFGVGDAGKVQVEVTGLLELLNGGRISSDTGSVGDAGEIVVEADQVRIDGVDGTTTGISTSAIPGSSGNAGSLTVGVSDLLEITGGGTISSDTFGSGDAGKVAVAAGSLRIDDTEGLFTAISSSALPGSAGDAGEIEIQVQGWMAMSNGGLILTDTSGSGNAGDISVTAGELTIDGEGPELTGISSSAYPGSAGRAGNLTVEVAGSLVLLDGAEIRSDTFSTGDAGSVRVQAGKLSVEGGESGLTGISSEAAAGASGGVGTLWVGAGELSLTGGGTLSIAHLGAGESSSSDARPLLSVSVGRLLLDGESSITAQSTGSTPAAAIEIHTEDGLTVTGSSRITTEAENADGGAIRITGGGVVLADGLITTSVEGAAGNGGDIDLEVDALVLDTGFIQANTAAAGASGGDIRIDTPSLVKPYDQELIVGGDERQVYLAGSGVNVIQAAAPDGVSGEVSVAALEQDSSAWLASVNAEYAPLQALSSDPCRVPHGEQPSSLTWVGRGGLPAGPEELLGLRAVRGREGPSAGPAGAALLAAGRMRVDCAGTGAR